MIEKDTAVIIAIWTWIVGFFIGFWFRPRQDQLTKQENELQESLKKNTENLEIIKNEIKKLTSKK